MIKICDFCHLPAELCSGIFSTPDVKVITDMIRSSGIKIFLFRHIRCNIYTVARMRRLYKTGIGSHTVTHNYSVYTLWLTTTESTLLLWRLRIQLCNHCCNQLLWRPLPSHTAAAPLSNTPSLTAGLVTNSLPTASGCELYSPWTDHKENTS
jgi:hypothetical protein